MPLSIAAKGYEILDRTGVQNVILMCRSSDGNRDNGTRYEPTVHYQELKSAFLGLVIVLRHPHINDFIEPNLDRFVACNRC